MALEDIKDSVKEQLNGLLSRVQESSAWIQIREKYDNLSPGAQKGALAGVVGVTVLILLLIPYVFYASSSSSIADFEDKQQLIRETFRVKRAASAVPVPPPAVNAGDLQSRARTVLTSSRLQPEQIVSVGDLGTKAPDVAATLEQAGVMVSVAKLNLTQVIDVGHELQLLHPLARLIGIDIRANKDNGHYFDAVYKIVAISAKPEPIAPVGKSSARGKGK